MSRKLIEIKNCRIENSREVLIPQIDWDFLEGESWLVTGENGGGKADFLNGLCGFLKITPNQDGIYGNIYSDSVEIVSLERAAKIIEEERLNDESDYVEGGVDIGRTGRIFIAEALYGKIGREQNIPELAQKIQTFPEIKLCGVEGILDRGLKYMSTGEIRRVLLARALISRKKLLILSDPFAGLDVQSRKILLDFFTNVVQRQQNTNSGSEYPKVILGMERWHEIPASITNVLEFTGKKISFCGKRDEYEQILKKREEENFQKNQREKEEFSKAVEKTISTDDFNIEETLVEMNHVNVGWGDHRVLVDLNWKLKKGEHWLVQGPNGSGKTTFLELITGDCMQVFSNDVRIFGIKRGSGESVWDIKKHLGIVSYRMHVEYRMLGGTSLQNVIISGFKDSIGLYEAATDTEIAAAKTWLNLGGFGGRENESFGNLSYGEQRAILILRSAVKNPKILILDEPCHGLDEEMRQKILTLMETIAEKGNTTMLHVTHDTAEILPCEKHILELCPQENPMYKIIEK